MSDFDALVDLIPIGDIAKQLGIDEKTATSAVKAAVPAIVGGLAVNAKDPKGEKSLEKALVKHRSSTAGRRNLRDIDRKDGEKIVNHVFGAKKDKVTAAVADKSGNATQDIIAQVLPIIAPIVLAWVASQFAPKAESAPTPAKEAAAPGNGIGDLLGGLLSSKEGQDIIGGVIGGLLAGKK